MQMVSCKKAGGHSGFTVCLSLLNEQGYGMIGLLKWKQFTGKLDSWCQKSWLEITFSKRKYVVKSL